MESFLIDFFHLVYFVICSYDDELSLYSIISTSYQSMSSTMGTAIFIFVRWSHHFASFYTTPLLPNMTSFSATSFPILHLLALDNGVDTGLSNLVFNYEQQILNPTISRNFSDDVRDDLSPPWEKNNTFPSLLSDGFHLQWTGKCRVLPAIPLNESSLYQLVDCSRSDYIWQ